MNIEKAKEARVKVTQLLKDIEAFTKLADAAHVHERVDATSTWLARTVAPRLRRTEIQMLMLLCTAERQL